MRNNEEKRGLKMKYLISMFVVLFSATLLVGCGGGESGSSSASTTTTTTPETTTPEVVAPTTPIETTPSYDLVIDNGRGTTNNQDTETPDSKD